MNRVAPLIPALRANAFTAVCMFVTLVSALVACADDANYSASAAARGSGIANHDYSNSQQPAGPGSDPQVYEVPPGSVRENEGRAFWAPLPAGMKDKSSRSSSPARSTLQLYEGDTPLGPRNAPHDVIRSDGGGAYSHWENGIYFSTSDGSDPRANGRVYRVEQALAATSADG